MPPSSKHDGEPDAVRVPGYNPWTLAVRAEFAHDPPRVIATWDLPGGTLEARAGRTSLWFVRRSAGSAILLRASYAPDGVVDVERLPDPEAGGAAFRVSGSSGVFRVELTFPLEGVDAIRVRSWLTPAEDLCAPFWPGDLYPADDRLDPTATTGVPHAAQRGTATGLVYLTLCNTSAGSILYVQDFGELQPWYETVKAAPRGRVGGRWPEFGYTPTPTPDTPVPAGKEILFSSAVVRFSPESPQTDHEVATLFLDLIAGIYPLLHPPATDYHDWPARARSSLDDLQHAPGCTVEELGHTYLHPYLDAEYPDAMAQAVVAEMLYEYADWLGKPVRFADKLAAGLEGFHDRDLCTMRRYLKTVGDDKDADEVDSWYLYHPLANLARMAARGHADAREMFLGSLDFAIRVARHFHYQWPVMYNVETLEVTRKIRKPGEPGQSDVGGLYAYVMLQAYDLTGEERFRHEAEAGIRAMKGLGFEIGYQFNIVAWGIAAAARLYRITGEIWYHQQALVLLASLVHNSPFYESCLGAAREYSTFWGLTCLHDGEYMSPFEEYEAFLAYHEYLDVMGDEAPASVRLLLAEHIRHTLHRGWRYYPEELPESALATEVRNGRLDRGVTVPLEDLWLDGHPAGSVGQEVYGSGAAFAFATRAFHRVPEAGMMVFVEYPVSDWQQDGHMVTFRLVGDPAFQARVRLVPEGGALPATARLNGEAVEEALVPGGGRVEVCW